MDIDTVDTLKFTIAVRNWLEDHPPFADREGLWQLAEENLAEMEAQLPPCIDTPIPIRLSSAMEASRAMALYFALLLPDNVQLLQSGRHGINLRTLMMLQLGAYLSDARGEVI